MLHVMVIHATCLHDLSATSSDHHDDDIMAAVTIGIPGLREGSNSIYISPPDAVWPFVPADVHPTLALVGPLSYEHEE
jgi:hypothetical protein